MQAQFSSEMTIQESAGRAFGLAIGNLFLAFFGFLWIVLGILSTGKTSLPVLTISPERMKAPVLALLSCFVLALVLVSVHIMRRTFRLYRAGGNTAQRNAINRRFGRINGVQWGAIIVVCFALNYAGLAAWILPAIILIVGIHFFPLASLFQNRMHYITGAAMVAWAILHPILFSPGKGDPIGAVGTGILLWESAVWMCWQALRLLRRMPADSTRDAIPNGAHA